MVEAQHLPGTPVPLNPETQMGTLADIERHAIQRALVVEERYTLLSEHVMRYEATLTDDEVYARPWQISLLLYKHLNEDAELLEYKCVEFSEDLLYGHLRRVEATP